LLHSSSDIYGFVLPLKPTDSALSKQSSFSVLSSPPSPLNLNLTDYALSLHPSSDSSDSTDFSGVSLPGLNLTDYAF